MVKIVLPQTAYRVGFETGFELNPNAPVRTVEIRAVPKEYPHGINLSNAITQDDFDALVDRLLLASSQEIPEIAHEIYTLGRSDGYDDE